jgi:hypothetical protein
MAFERLSGQEPRIGKPSGFLAGRPGRLAFLGYVALALIFFFRVIFRNDSIPWDMNNWHYPQLAFLGSSILRGEFPLWNPCVYCGMPFSGDIQAAAFYPVNLLFLLAGGLIQGHISYRLIEYELILHYLMAGCSAYVLAREYCKRPFSAFICGLVYMFGPFAASNAQHFGLIIGLAWLPIMLLMLKRTIERCSLVWPCLLAVSISMHIFAGFFPATMAAGLVLVAVAVFSLVLVYMRSSGWSPLLGAFVRLTIALLMVLGISAIQLLPAYDLASSAIPGVNGREFGPAFYHVITSVIPNFFNSYRIPLYWGRGDVTQTYFYFSPMIFILALWACIYSSAAIYILACAFITLAISTGLVAPIFDHIRLPEFMEGHIDLYTLRGFYELGIGIAAGIGVDALSLGYFSQTERARKWTYLLSSLILIFVLSAAITGHIFASIEPQSGRAIVSSCLQSALIITVSIFAIKRWLLRDPPSMANAVIFLLIFVPLFVYGSHRDFNSSPIPPDSLSSTTVDGRPGVIKFLRKKWAEGGPFRIECVGKGTVLWATEVQLWNFEDANGNNPLVPKDVYMVCSRFSGKSDVPWVMYGRPFGEINILSPFISMLNIRYVVVSQIDALEDGRLVSMLRPDRFKLVYSDEYYRVYDNLHVLPRAYFARKFIIDKDMITPGAAIVDKIGDLHNLCITIASSYRDLCADAGSDQPGNAEGISGQVSFVSYSANKMKIKASVPYPASTLVILERYWRGWTAKIDGAPTAIHKANCLFMAIKVPGGEHVIELKFQPASFIWGLAITAVSLPIFLLILVCAYRRERLTPMVKSFEHNSTQDNLQC